MLDSDNRYRPCKSCISINCPKQQTVHGVVAVKRFGGDLMLYCSAAASGSAVDSAL